LVETVFFDVGSFLQLSELFLGNLVHILIDI
jgi:hypothetical protein